MHMNFLFFLYLPRIDHLASGFIAVVSFVLLFSLGMVIVVF